MKSNILLILGSIFALSMVGRSFALNIGVVAAKDKKPQAEASTEYKQEGKTRSHEPKAGEVCITGPMLESFKERREALEVKEKEIAERERTLEAVEKRVEERMAALENSNNQLEEKMALLKRTAKEDIVHLTNMYESMKPQQASAIFNKMDSVFAAGFLREMQTTQAGLILANMDQDKAYEISIIIASKNADLRPKIQ